MPKKPYSKDPITIKIEFDYYAEKKLILPERIVIARNTKVQWLINAFDEYPLLNSRSRGLHFTLYFPTQSPFPWREESTRIYFDPFYRRSFDPIILAEATPYQPGEYKYGVKVSKIGQEEPIYDEDPYLIIL